MALVIDELPSSRSYVIGKDTISGTLEYFLKGSDDVATVRAKIQATAPATFPGVTGLVRGDISPRPLGGSFWYATVAYVADYAPILPAVGGAGPPTPVSPLPGLNVPLGADISFDLTGQTEHITQSIQTISRTARTGFPALPDTKGAVGVNADGEVQGCDVPKPYLEWHIARTFNSITLAYIRTISQLVGKVNNALFAGFDTGTTMFIGASGNTKDASKTVVTFKFVTQEHRTNITICDGLVVPSKKAWEYLWVSYKNVETGLHLTQQPVGAYVEQVVREGDFSVLGIGT